MVQVVKFIMLYNKDLEIVVYVQSNKVIIEK